MQPRLLSPPGLPLLAGRGLVALAVVASSAVLFGLNAASDPQTYLPQSSAAVALAADEPCEDDYRNVINPEHNLRIFALREALDERGYLLDGERSLADDPLSAIRGTFGMHSPGECHRHCEWRLMATRATTCQPCSMVRMYQELAFSPEIASALVEEWQTGAAVLPPQLIAAGERLLTEAVILWQTDQDSARTATSGGAGVRQRGWRTFGRQREYCLELVALADDYEVVAELTDRPLTPDRAPSSELALHFTWLR